VGLPGRAVRALSAVEAFLQRISDVSVQAVGDVAVDDRQRLVGRQRAAIGPVGGQRLIDVGHGKHAHRHVEIVGAQ
jgi:hypothetical protein